MEENIHGNLIIAISVFANSPNPDYYFFSNIPKITFTIEIELKFEQTIEKIVNFVIFNSVN